MHKHITALFAAILTCILTAATPRAGTLDITPITDTKGNAPHVDMVEMQFDTVRVWAAEGLKGKPLILLSESIPVMPPRSESEEAAAVKAVRAGRAGDVTSRYYPTPDLYPIDMSNYITYLHRLGIIDRVYWVPPVRGSVGNEPVESFREYLRAYGASDEELAGLKQEKTYISCKINGVPIIVSSLGELAPPINDALMVVDVHFLSMLYQNEVKEPFLDLFAQFAGALSAVSPKLSHVAISYSTAFGDVPLERRYIGGYIRTLFTDPAALKESPPDIWLIRAQAMYNETFFQTDETLELYKKGVELAPDDPDTVYDLALGYFAIKNLDSMKEYLDRAVRLDNGYYPAYFFYADHLTEKGVFEASKDFLDEASKYAPDDPRIILGYHKLHEAQKDTKAMVADQERIVGLGFDSTENLKQLAEDYSADGRYAESIETYKRAIKTIPVMGDDRMPALLLGLAETYEKARMLDQADETFRKAAGSTANRDVQGMINARYGKFRSDWQPFMEKKQD